MSRKSMIRRKWFVRGATIALCAASASFVIWEVVDFRSGGALANAVVCFVQTAGLAVMALIMSEG